MRNVVTSLLDNNGVEHLSEDAKRHIAVEYFENLFTSSNPGSAANLFEGFEAKVTKRMNRDLIRPVREAEIKNAVKAIKGDSATGADGMFRIFFQ